MYFLLMLLFAYFFSDAWAQFYKGLKMDMAALPGLITYGLITYFLHMMALVPTPSYEGCGIESTASHQRRW